MLGHLTCSGVGMAFSPEASKDVQQLQKSCESSNKALLAQLREVTCPQILGMVSSVPACFLGQEFSQTAAACN